MAYQDTVRLGIFFGVLAVMMWWEYKTPARQPVYPRWLRYSSNIGLVVLDTILLRVLFPVLAVGAAIWANQEQIGLLNWITLSTGLKVVIAFLLLDLAIYFQHVLTHAIPILWRFHQVHHADLEFDTTTGIRFHPISILISMVIKLSVVVLLGAPALAVILFEISLSAGAVFNHANIRLPKAVETILRLIIVTPDMHRIHHSAVRDETNSNFGFGLSIWDRLFGTYQAQPAAGHQGMTIGLERFRQQKDLYLHRVLLQPFMRNSSQ